MCVRLLHAAQARLRLAWDGLTRPRWLAGTFLRTLLAHGMPHFENSFATRGAHPVGLGAARFLGP